MQVEQVYNLLNTVQEQTEKELHYKQELLQQGFDQAQAARQQDFANRFGIFEAQTGLAGAAMDYKEQTLHHWVSGRCSTTATTKNLRCTTEKLIRLQAFEPQTRLDTYGRGIAQLISGYPGSGSTFTQTPNLTPLETALGFGLGVADLFGELKGIIMSRILKRPMFRMGGSTENSGIMDGMRNRYDNGGSVEQAFKRIR